MTKITEVTKKEFESIMIIKYFERDNDNSLRYKKHDEINENFNQPKKLILYYNNDIHVGTYNLTSKEGWIRK